MRTRFFCAALGATFLIGFAGTALAQYRQVLSFDQMIAPIVGEPTTLATSVNDGSASFHAIKRSNPTQSWIVRVDDFNTGAPSASVLFDWGAENLNPGRAWGLAGNDLVIGDGTTDTVYKVDVTTGARTEYLSTAQLLAQTGGDALQGNSSYVMPTGELIFLETDTDALYVTNGPGTVETFLSNTALVNAMGNDAVSSQLAVDASGRYYFGNNTNDVLYVYDPALPAPNPGDNIASILSASDIAALTGAASVGFGDMIYDPGDDLIYFRELTSRYFLSFDPDDPANTLAVVLTQAQLEAGPAAGSFTIGPFSLVDGELAWSFNATTSGNTGYYAIPEPATLLLVLAGGLLLRRRV